MPIIQHQTSQPSSLSTPQAAGWVGLNSRFIAAKPPAEQAQIRDLSTSVEAAATSWAQAYPAIRQVRIAPLAIKWATVNPYVSVEALLPALRFCLWIYWFDDLLDEELAPPRQLRQWIAHSRELITHASDCPADEPLLAVIKEVCNDLEQYPLYALLSPGWRAGMCRLLDGMLREYDWRVAYRQSAGVTLPTYAAYLANGRDSIGYLPCIWSALITTTTASFAPEELAYLYAFEEAGSTCLRLANDLRSYQREIKEGSINAVLLLHHQFRGAGLPADEALQSAETYLRTEITRRLNEVDALLAHPPTPASIAPATVIADWLHFACDFYARYDYHTFDTLG